MSGKPGYHGMLLNVDLSTGKVAKVAITPEDLGRFVGGQGLGMKILWDRLKRPGVDPLSPENPLMFMPGPFSGLRADVVASALTSGAPRSGRPPD